MAAARPPESPKPRRAPARRPAAARRVRGGTILGFMIGLVVGLTVAVVVALFVTRAPVPFVNKAGRAPERVIEPKSPAEAPDPNKPLYSKSRPAPAAEAPGEAPAAGGAQPDDRAGILERLFGRRADDAAPVTASPATPAAKGEPRPADARASVDPRPADARPAEPRPEAERTSYLLQAGAFRGQEDADAMRGRLALVGFEARVVAAEVNGQTMYRVRVGPFAQLDDMNKARARLAENGIEASVVRLK